MKKITFFLLGACFFLVANYLFMGYGNSKVHPNLNAVMVEKFQRDFVSPIYADKFKNYLFVFNGPGLPGTEVSKSGFLSINESETEKSPLEWIAHGGFSADEPEIFASFRHFYDPTEPEGNRYLHNHLDHIVGVDNPKIDQIEWAIDHPDHEYNWRNGKVAVINALTHTDTDYKDKEMAFAFRALGETLHMIGDMGCPAHVRDDSHAAEPFTGYQFGSPDPYEEIFEKYYDINTHFSTGVTDASLKTYFKGAKDVESISIKLAEYTNANYFTTQTISGNEVVPLIHPEKTYASPTLEQCEYDDLDYIFTKNISGNQVIMCKDLKYRLGIFSNRGYPYIDKQCVVSQGNALVPQITEAGANVIRLFIPKLEVKILGYYGKKDSISLKVVHTMTEEYPQLIRYTGKVALCNAKNGKKLAEVDCEKGEYNGKIDSKDFLFVNWDKYGIYAEIEFGRIYVRSENFKMNTVAFNNIQCWISDSTNFLNYTGWDRSYTWESNYYSIGQSGKPEVCNISSRSFEIRSATNSDWGYVTTGTIDNNQKITSISFEENYEYRMGGVLEERRIKKLILNNLSISLYEIETSGYNGIQIDIESGTISNISDHEESVHSGKMIVTKELTGYNSQKLYDTGVLMLEFTNNQ